MSNFAVITSPQAKRIVKAHVRAIVALGALSDILAASGVASLVDAPKTKKQPRKAKAKKVAKEAPKPTKATDPLTA